MDYGELVDDYNPQQDYIYSLFVKYFNNPTLTKIKNENQFSMYACKIYGLLANQHKYIILFTHLNQDPVGTMEPMRDMKWVNLQTRTLTENLKCNSHTYTPTNDSPLSVGIKRVDKTKQASTYECLTLPLTINLLHTAKKDANTYQNEGTIVAALETYETVVTIL
jgi:hypothetical protein